MQNTLRVKEKQDPTTPGNAGIRQGGQDREQHSLHTINHDKTNPNQINDNRRSDIPTASLLLQDRVLPLPKGPHERKKNSPCAEPCPLSGKPPALWVPQPSPLSGCVENCGGYWVVPCSISTRNLTKEKIFFFQVYILHLPRSPVAIPSNVAEGSPWVHLMHQPCIG